MTLKVVQIKPARAAEVEDDEYLPLSVHWMSPGSAGTPAYYFVRGSEDAADGYIELKMEPLTGEVIGLIVITMPKRRELMPGFRPSSLPTVAGAVCVDLSNWDLERDQFTRQGQVDELCSLVVIKDETHVYFALSDITPVCSVLADGIGFGLGPENELAGIVVSRDLNWDQTALSGA